MRAKLSILIFCCMVLATALPSAAQNTYSSTELDTLVGPIALYPDPVLTNVVKAATFPDQVVAASTTNVDDTSWDDSVKALDDYPDVLTMMASNLDWTKSLGWAATNQLADTMDAVQRYRYRAQQAGNLSSNSKTQIIQEGTTIRIEPADPQVVYVPSYVYTDVDDSDFSSAFYYGAGVATSAYLWSNMYHWNNNSFYTHPYGWAPAASYYRPYGWQNGGVYAGTTARLTGTNVARGSVNVNNVNYNRVNVNNANVNRVNVNNANVNRANVNNANVNRANYNNANYNANRVQTSRTNSYSRSTSPGLGSYSSAGSTMRESNRGAYSRGSSSFSSGARMGGGGGRRR